MCPGIVVCIIYWTIMTQRIFKKRFAIYICSLEPCLRPSVILWAIITIVTPFWKQCRCDVLYWLFYFCVNRRQKVQWLIEKKWNTTDTNNSDTNAYWNLCWWQINTINFNWKLIFYFWLHKFYYSAAYKDYPNLNLHFMVFKYQVSCTTKKT